MRCQTTGRVNSRSVPDALSRSPREHQRAAQSPTSSGPTSAASRTARAIAGGLPTGPWQRPGANTVESQAEVATGTYTRRSAITVAEACDEWLAGRRGIRTVTLQGYTHDLRAVRRYLGGKKLQHLTKADGDALVEWMLTEGRSSRKRYRPGSLAARVGELIGSHPEGISSATIAAALPEHDVHTCLSGLLRAGRVTRLRRAVYVLNDADSDKQPAGGVKPVTVRSTLTTFGMVVQSFVDQGALTRNVVALVERPADELIDDRPETSKSWTLAEVEHFRAVGKRRPAVRLLAAELLRASPF